MLREDGPTARQPPPQAVPSAARVAEWRQPAQNPSSPAQSAVVGDTESTGERATLRTVDGCITGYGGGGGKWGGGGLGAAALAGPRLIVGHTGRSGRGPGKRLPAAAGSRRPSLPAAAAAAARASNTTDTAAATDTEATKWAAPRERKAEPARSLFSSGTQHSPSHHDLPAQPCSPVGGRWERRLAS